MPNQQNNNDYFKMYDPLKCSHIKIFLNGILKNIKSFNLCNISHSNLDKICLHFDLNQIKEINELIKIIILLTNNLYSSNEKLDTFNNSDIDHNLFKNTIGIMKTLGIIGSDTIFYHLKKHELQKNINGIIALISVRISCKDKYIDTKSLIIIYYSLAILLLRNRKAKNMNHIKSIMNINTLPDFNTNDIKQCCLNYC